MQQFKAKESVGGGEPVAKPFGEGEKAVKRADSSGSEGSVSIIFDSKNRDLLPDIHESVETTKAEIVKNEKQRTLSDHLDGDQSAKKREEDPNATNEDITESDEASVAKTSGEEGEEAVKRAQSPHSEGDSKSRNLSSGIDESFETAKADIAKKQGQEASNGHLDGNQPVKKDEEQKASNEDITINSIRASSTTSPIHNRRALPRSTVEQIVESLRREKTDADDSPEFKEDTVAKKKTVAFKEELFKQWGREQRIKAKTHGDDQYGHPILTTGYAILLSDDERRAYAAAHSHLEDWVSHISDKKKTGRIRIAASQLQDFMETGKFEHLGSLKKPYS